MFKNITLELSLKPFKSTDAASIKEVCSKIFDDWATLLKGRECISVMLWCADGSEILDYNRKPGDEFEWCKYLGTANKELLGEGDLSTSLHTKKQLYIPDPPVMTYRILKNIVSAIKSEGNRRFPNAKIRVGETFDIGPEFAVSSFKYERHKEITEGSSRIDHLGFVDATSLLHADERAYAAYPYGIPEGLPFARFFGKQADIFLRDMGFDYIWLSNGLGFSADPWKVTGKIFDGEAYHPEKLSRTAEQVFSFWKMFREECSFPIETRGTNNTVGIDYASDGVPLHDIYSARLGITAPPNSPWAAINRNYGLEIAGHMSRCCELPSEVLPFRYYLHDPWWVNSPWYDRYEGKPTDIYLPMSISRIDADGCVGAANSLNILSIDNSFGDMPDACVSEPLPHLLKAEKNAPDAIAPIVWVYPMREYTTSRNADMLKEMHEGDSFICASINDAFPLCCVTSTDSFIKQNPDIYKGRVILSPAKTSESTLEKLYTFAENGGFVILYGSETDSIKAQSGVIAVNISDGAEAMRKALCRCGYSVRLTKKNPSIPSPVMSISRCDGAFIFSVYNPNATTDVKLSFPLGAPIMIGGEVEVNDSDATYRFPRFTYGECRVFIKQKDGIVECREMPPVNRRYRRKLLLSGLNDAEICFFPERGVDDVIISDATTHDPIDGTPIAIDGALTKVDDESHGVYYKAKNLCGKFVISMGYKSK